MLHKIHINDKKVPFIFLLVLVASFVPLIAKLGFFWDDWPVMYMARTQGISGFWNFYQYDRPFSAWTYIVTVPVLGTNPIGWHIFSLLLRWLTVVFLWLTLRKIWPEKSRQTFWIALLFSVYPLFDQQSVAVAYSQHWICYFFYFVSIYLMLLSQEKKKYYYPLVGLSALFSLIQMFSMEYFLGLELFRPIILWVYHINHKKSAGKFSILKKSLFTSWIYLAILGIYVVWRIFFLELAGSDPNDPELLNQLKLSPLHTLLDLTQTAIQDLIYFFSSWITVIRPADIELRRPFFIASTGVATVTAALIWLLLSRYNSFQQATDDDDKKWHRQAVFFGTIAALFGTLPVWMIGKQASIGLYGSRFGLAAMFGLSIAVVGLLEWLSNRTSVKNIVIGILIGIAIFFHLNIAKDFQDSWKKQQKVYWQLYWRAPYIEPGTAIISDGEIFRFVGQYSTSMGIALLYPPVENPKEMPYWFFDMIHGNLFLKTDELYAGIPLRGSLRNYSFNGHSKNALILYLPEENQCVQILTANDINDRDIPNLLQPVVPLSNLEQIKSNDEQDWSPPATIFGEEPEHTWCYYFEKAELAQQYQDWEEVLTIMDEAKEQGYSPANVKEYFPWLNGYLHTGRIEEARTLTRQMKKLSHGIDDQICYSWLDAKEKKPSEMLDAAYQIVRTELSCFD